MLPFKPSINLALLLLLPLSCLATNKPNIEGDALIQILRALNDSSHRITDWDAHFVSPCFSWSHVTCRNGSVVTLSLPGNGFTGSLSPSIAKLESLVSLDLRQNNLSGNLPDSISSLLYLQNLNLADNNFNGSIPATWGQLPDLKHLVLRGNQLSGSIPESLTNITALLELDVSFNGLTGKIPDHLFSISTSNNLVLRPHLSQKLQDSSMVPNHTLRHLIHDWLHSNGYSDNCLDDQASIGRIKRVVESDEFGFHEKILALEEVYSLCQELPIENTCLIKLDFFKILIEQVFRNVGSLLLVEKSLSCALKLMPFSDLECLNILKEDSNHAVLLRLFEEGGFSIKKGLCLMVEAISSELRTRNLGAAVRALTALSSIESNRISIARNGAIEGLIACLTYAESRKRSLAAVAMAAIEILLSEIIAREALLNHPSGVRAVVKMVFRVSEHEGSESAVNALVNVCSECEAAREAAIGGGVLTQLLLLLQSQCNARIKSKARLLLKLLRSK